jgi:CubicO group peptidase (beta-lactamase class C family)
MALIASPSVATDRDVERIVTRHVASIVPPDGAGGIAVALRIEGRSLFLNYGWADRANKRPITPDTLFNLASLRKVFEATLLAQSVRNGDVRLDGSRRQIYRRAATGRRHPPIIARADRRIGSRARTRPARR